MTTNFPVGIDSFVNPSGSNTLGQPGVLHSVQHTNINDSVFAVETRIGVTGSAVPTTIDYELHNTQHGHDHDGINSRPIKLGTSGSVSGSGYFNISPSSSAGETIFNINVALLDLSSSISSLAVSASQIAFESQTVELTPSAVRVNLTGSGVSGSVSSSMGGDKVTYTIPGIDYRQVVFLREGGPFEHFSPNMYHSCVYYPGAPFISASLWFTDSSKTNKIFETEYSERNNRKQATTIIYRVYNEDGFSLKTTITDIITYSGITELSRTRMVT